MMRAVASGDEASVLWLRTLRWIDRADIAWLILLPAAWLLWMLALWPYLGWPAVALPCASHGALALLALACAPRGRLLTYCGLVLLSQLHFLVFTAMGFTQLQQLGWAYAAIATATAVICSALQLGSAARYRATLKAAQRDGYRWLLTRAPLPWRVLFVRALSRLPR
jgi:hypothetical protein